VNCVPGVIPGPFITIAIYISRTAWRLSLQHPMANGQWHREAGASLTDSHGMVVHVVLATGEAVLTEVPAVCEEKLPHRTAQPEGGSSCGQQSWRGGSRSEVTKK
jgi:hypothetical protein